MDRWLLPEVAHDAPLISVVGECQIVSPSNRSEHEMQIPLRACASGDVSRLTYRVEATGVPQAAKRLRTNTFTDRVEAFFRARPNIWIDGLALEAVGGKYAWRSRVSDCRRLRGMVIENQLRDGGGFTISEYRFVPKNSCVTEEKQ